jgi:hypothetical protein
MKKLKVTRLIPNGFYGKGLFFYHLVGFLYSLGLEFMTFKHWKNE